MTLTIELAPEEEAQLRRRAESMGKQLDAYVREAALESAARPTFAEILAPIHERTRQAGVTVEEIDQLGERLIAEVRRERRAEKLGETG